ncbi:HD domain-containing protein [Paenibacillus eucommiae]|uniref:HD superfamily phosphohydrolase n=1 Tax=Paenibacillus eucommiae TaxID=1355755 RepID=A0ABS4J599_9BACL|nr:HD domain-containing protein [Paenibacillus eucommiae]MBP1995019.1 HD superfamily phosphohydrolase [Paenibacillus eucommiae]
MSLENTFASGRIWEPLYRWEKTPHKVEIELFQSPPVRRLKFLHHIGASALFTPIVHSRLEHTIGVWSLMAHFFPKEPLLRIAALLHDIGHLPFSHAVEKTLGFDHHAQTNLLIEESCIADILHRHNISPASIIAILNQDSPLSGHHTLLGLDHLDSFLRDTYAAGKYTIPPYEMIRKLRFRGEFIETDQAAALPLVTSIIDDHRMLLQPEFLAMDALLAKAVIHHYDADPGVRADIQGMVDHELIHVLKQSKDATASDIIRVLLHEPHRIIIRQEPAPGSIQVQIRKLCKKQPLINGLPASEVCVETASKLAELDSLTATYFFTYS